MPRANAKPSPSLLRHLHARQVLGALQQHGPMSRADISRYTGISGPTVTRTVTDLIGANLLEEGEFQEVTLGRPGKFLRLASSRVSVLGVAVGVHHCELVSAGLDGRIHPDTDIVFDTPPRYAELIRIIVQHARRLIKASGTEVLGLGVSIPGLLNRRQGRTVFSPNLHQTDGHRLGEDLRRQLELEVAILQETRALCVAEQTYGAAKGVADFAVIDITDGLGMGVVQDGQLVEGHSGLAGELGHVTVELHGRKCGCGNHGCLETVATDAALAVKVSERLGRKLSIEELLPLIQSGEVEAGHEMELVLQYLAIGLATIINVFNPSKLFVYGRLLDAGPFLFERLLELTRQRALAPSMAECEIIRARGNKRQGAVAGIIQRLTTGREQPLE